MGVLSRIADAVERALGDDPAESGLADPTPEEPTRMTPDQLLAHATEFRFPIYPEGSEYTDLAEFAITVEWRGDNRWAVASGGWNFTANGERDYEPLPSGREDAWLTRFRFTRDEAIRVAREVVVPAERARWDARVARTTPEQETDRG